MSADVARGRVSWLGPRAAARALCGVSAVLASGRLVLAIADPRSSDAATGPGVPGGGIPVAAFEAVVLVMLAVVGAIVASRRRDNPIGWILCAIPVALGLLTLGAHGSWSLVLAHPDGSDAAAFSAWLASWVWIGVMVPALVLFPLLFPTGAPPGPRWRPVLWVALAAGVAMFIGEAFKAGRFADYPVDNPVGAQGALGDAVAVVGALGFVLLLIATVSAVASMIGRFRRSRGEERQQLKWVTSAATLFVALFVAPTQQVVDEDTGFSMLLFGLLVVAVAVAIAMLRHRLYDIDVVINRALVYATLTASIAAAYLAAVLVLEFVLRPLTDSSHLAVAGSTLAVAAFVGPARARIQAVVDRRFFRSRYDARRTLDRFTAGLRDEVGLDALSVQLQGVVANTMHPAHVSLWLRSPEVRR